MADSLESIFYAYLNSAKAQMKMQPIYLGGYGGPNGGSGGPPGGFVGQLSQGRVAYDSTEAELITTTSGGTLVDNLNHIRYRINVLEEGGVTVSGIGHIIQEEGSSLPNRSKLNFVGASVSAIDDVINNATVVSITISGGGGGDVSGPASSVADNFASFSNITGKLLKDSGKKASDFANTSHVHIGTDITSGTIGQDRLGSGSSGAGTKYLADDQTWKTITVSGTGGGHTIQNNGSDMTSRTKLNFKGSGVSVTDNSGDGSTDVTITISGTAGSSTMWEAHAKPSSPTSYDDEFDNSSFDTGKWTTWDVGSCISSLDEDGRGLVIIADTSNRTKLGGIIQTAPTTPFTVWSKIQVGGDNAAYYWSLLVGDDLLSDPSTESFYTGGIWVNGIGMEWRVNFWDDYNNDFNRALWSTNMGFPYLYMYVRARVTDTDIYFDFSQDGISWYNTGTEGLDIDPITIGLAFMNYDSDDFNPMFHSSFFRVTNSADFDQIMPGNRIKMLV